MSKSGLFAHFGSKEELQLATIETANALFDEHVVEPALARPTGIERLRRSSSNYLRHVEERRLPGRLLLRLGADRDGHAPRAGPRRRARGHERLARAARADGPRRPGGGRDRRRRRTRRSSSSRSRPPCYSRTRCSSSPAVRPRSSGRADHCNAASRKSRLLRAEARGVDAVADRLLLWCPRGLLLVVRTDAGRSLRSRRKRGRSADDAPVKTR